MTVSTTSSRTVLAGNGVTTAFPTGFRVDAPADLVVTYTDTNGNDTVISSGLYTTDGHFGSAYPNGPTITYSPVAGPIATGTTLTLERVISPTQPTSLNNQGAMWPAAIEGALDRLTMVVQRFIDGMSRALRIEATDGTVLDTVPDATTRANGYLGFDETGQPTVLAAPAGSTPISVAMAAVVNKSTLALARSTMGAAGTADANAFLGDNTHAGNESHSGNDSHSGTETFTGKVKMSKPIVTGGSSFIPQGRLTLATGVPVMVSAQTAKATVYYTPHNGNLIPIYDGTDTVATVFAELSNDLTASSTGKAGPAAATTNSNYDLFVWSDSGTVRLTRGPLWTSDTGRGSGAGTTELQRVNGLLTNKNAITNGPGANLGTYVGTIRTDGSSQANWQPGAVAANGTAAILGVWNAHNRIDVRGMVGDSTDSWSYATATIRPANNSSTMRASFVVGWQEDYVWARYDVSFLNSATSGGGFAGVGYDSTTAFSGKVQEAICSSAAGSTVFAIGGSDSEQPLGFHYLQALEKGNATGTMTWYGDNGGIAQNGLEYHGRF